jgi:hypothetical protein
MRPKLRATNEQFQSMVALKSGQAQRSTGYIKKDVRRYRPVVRKFKTICEASNTLLEPPHKNGLRGLCYRDSALSELLVETFLVYGSHIEKWLNAPYWLD